MLTTFRSIVFIRFGTSIWLEAVDRMEIDKRLCCYCGTCVNICPQGAIELVDTGEVEIDKTRCVQCPCIRWPCGLCIKICPMGAIEV